MSRPTHLLRWCLPNAPRSAPARGRGDRHDPRARADDAALPGQRAADPRRHPHLRGHRGGDHVPLAAGRSCGRPSAMLTGSGVALILRVPSTPARRPLEHPRLVRVRRRRRVLAADEVPHPLPRARTCSTRRTSGSSSCSSCSAARASSRSTSGGRPSTRGMIAGLRRHPGRRAAHHRAASGSSPRRRRSGSRWPPASACSPRRATAWSPAGRSRRCAASTTGA